MEHDFVESSLLTPTHTRSQIKRLSLQSQGTTTAQSALIEQHSAALIQQTSSILNIVTATPAAIADLRAATTAHSQQQSVETRQLRRGLEAASQHLDALSLSSKSTEAAAQEQASALGWTVKRLGALIRDIRKLFVL